jgi:NAD(P)-dependent dehydrogenase (short-subunit alcohol dehydrogenase family)
MRLANTEPAGVEATMTGVVQRFGKLDVLYNNAGASHGVFGPLHTLDVDGGERIPCVGMLSAVGELDPIQSTSSKGGYEGPTGIRRIGGFGAHTASEKRSLTRYCECADRV